MNIPYTITQLRHRANLSQKVIGDAIGCSQSTVSEMEAGICGVKRPSFKLVSNLQTLAKEHGISTELPDSNSGP